MNVLIAYDGSECSEGALDELKRAGLPAELDALIYSIAEVWLPAPAAEKRISTGTRTPYGVIRARARALHLLEETRERAAGAASRLAASFPQWRVASDAAADSPAWGILARAEEWRADLIVVGSQGRSRLGRLFLGSVSLKILTEARCSVRIARDRRWEGTEPERIVIGYDGSPDADAAVDAVASRRWHPGAAVHLIAVVDLPMPHDEPPIGEIVDDPAEGERRYREELEWIHERLDDAASRLRGAGLVARPFVIEGDPRSVLVKSAEEWGADAIVLGATGTSAVERFLLGSVASAIAARAHCSVELVRTGSAGVG